MLGWTRPMWRTSVRFTIPVRHADTATFCQRTLVAITGFLRELRSLRRTSEDVRGRPGGRGFDDTRRMLRNCGRFFGGRVTEYGRAILLTTMR